MSSKNLYIIDGHALIYRSYFALQKQKLSSSKCTIMHNGRYWDMPTGACYGYTQYLLNILKNYNPEYIIAIMDSGKLNWRHDIYPNYKANRDSMPEDLKLQLPKIYEITRALGITLCIEEGIEADDLIYSYSLKHKYKSNLEPYIITKDKDLMQLTTYCKILSPNGRGFDLIDSDYVKNKFGVSPFKLADYLAMVGDTSDNIPGVKGIGPKKAAQLLAYSGYDTPNITESASMKEQLKAVEQLKTIMESEDFKLSRTLVSLRNYGEKVLEKNLIKRKPINISWINELFEKLEFKSLSHLLKALL